MNSFPSNSYLGGKQYAIHLNVICIYIFYYMIRNLFSHRFTATGAQDPMFPHHVSLRNFNIHPQMEQPLRNLNHAYDQNENGKHLIWFWFNCRFRFTGIVVRSHSFHQIQWKTFHPWHICFFWLNFSMSFKIHC